MKTLRIDRTKESANATLSKITSVDVPGLELWGLERKWQGNRSNISCVPDGTYALVPWTSPKYGDVWSLTGGTVTPHADDSPHLAARWGCLIHPANYWDQLQGCLAPGQSSGEHKGDLCVWSSKAALAELKAALGYELHVAYIRWTP